MNKPPISRRSKRADLSLHVSRQNLVDGIAGDQENCTFGQCAVARERGMTFMAAMDLERPRVVAEWITKEGDYRVHHRADVVKEDRKGKTTAEEALMIVFATDTVKKKLLKKFPQSGMDFVLANHTVRKSAPSTSQPKAGETVDPRLQLLWRIEG